MDAIQRLFIRQTTLNNLVNGFHSGEMTYPFSTSLTIDKTGIDGFLFITLSREGPRLSPHF
jgi:hypothetical protein